MGDGNGSEGTEMNNSNGFEGSHEISSGIEGIYSRVN